MNNDEVSLVQNKLIENSVAVDQYPDGLFHQHMFEQYKICIEMADRVSQRRNLANTLFLTLNTGVLTALAVTLEKVNIGDAPSETGLTLIVSGFSIIALISLILVCCAWQTIITSYRQLNRAKYLVIGAYERMLPTSPYYHAEWCALGEGKDPDKYTQLNVVESFIPKCLIFAYTLIIAFLVLRHLIGN